MAAHISAFLHPENGQPPYLGNPQGLANEMLKECLETDEVRDIVSEVYSMTLGELPPIDDWVNRMLEALPPTPAADPESGPLPSLNRLASHYLTNLCIAIWDPTGPSTPQTSTHPSADRLREFTIQNLLHEAGELHRSSALKALVELRDGLTCPVSDWSMDSEHGGVVGEIAHIIPFFIYSKTVTHQAIEAFTGMNIDSATILHLMNHPKNSLILNNGSHHAFDAFFAWGIEATTNPDGTIRYFVRAIRPNRIPKQIMGHKVDEEIFFGTGERGEEIAPPDPRFCNLKLNVFRVLYASGVGEALEKFWRDYDRASLASSSLGVSQEMDNLLMNKLAVLCF